MITAPPRATDLKLKRLRKEEKERCDEAGDLSVADPVRPSGGAAGSAAARAGAEAIA
eukprot:COSAG01_NODE_20705_length_939_cov_1.408333_2_plen_56_part_01